MAKPVLVFSAALAAVLVAGCAPADPAGQPTYSCTPEAGGTPYPCYKVQRDELNKLDALYAEAEAVYRTYLTEDERIWRAGGVAAATPVMQQTLSGEALASALAFYRALGSTDTKLVGGDVKLAWVKRVPDDIRPGMVVALQACVDQHTALMASKGEPSESAGFFSDVINFTRDGGSLKIAQLDAPKSGEVTSC